MKWKDGEHLSAREKDCIMNPLSARWLAPLLPPSFPLLTSLSRCNCADGADTLTLSPHTPLFSTAPSLSSPTSRLPSAHSPCSAPTLTVGRSGGVLLSIKQWLVALGTPPPPRLHYILSNKPERTNVSSPKYCPYLLNPPYPTPAPPGINIRLMWFRADLHLTLKHILCMYEHFPIWVPLPPLRVFTR